ncbi:EAL domain, c-di-GMP-specific phosphodiesterase class I (or its enzymatically inactive variant) [Nitrosospira sp. Nl5]|uniref:EAL domain-containing protein n=1 Tax=Nitrosospira sp. Nl5 TaxID=200120 RepID=UPI0008828B5A|nr:EAL domain-containing protein [Nitrosospira sp. Nl5]SCY36602.1 EAL domain, c-di-GMP-specific phosphodiesterase class I (or its enzymatically inactive variant) [Nitrosospira sp. Nl5]
MNARKAHDALTRVQATDDQLQRSEDGWIVGHFLNSRLSSVFQPVFDGSRRNVIGHAAYVRSESGDKNILSPWSIFTLASNDTLLVSLDRLCRTVHAINYFGAVSGQGNLFVSVQPRLLESVKDDHGRAFEKVLNLIEVATSRVVIEMPLEVNRDARLLKRVISNYRSRGYRISAHPNGASGTWMAELGALYPDIVRLDASALLQYNHALPLLDTVHRFGAALLVRDIETSQQLDASVRAGADLLQGRFLGGPAPMLA